MAIIRFKDGSAKYTDHYKAAKVYQVLIGKEEPENAAQAAFVRTVATVEFPTVTMPGQPASKRLPSAETIKERRRRIQQIRMDPTLTGKQKYYAIGEVLYGRNLQPVQKQQQLV